MKAIVFNEYFDTVVDDKIISSASLNGKLIKGYLHDRIDELDAHITGTHFEPEELLDKNADRQQGKNSAISLAVCACIKSTY